MNGKGALPSQELKRLLEVGFIIGAQEENISPASLDLSLSDEMYCITGLLLPRRNERVRDLLEHMGATQCSLDAPFEAGKMYLVRLNESLELPKDIYGYCNPKSSTGRLDMHVRVLADGVPRFDSVTPRGFTGELWAAVHPKSFGIQLHEGSTLTQLRLFNDDARLSEYDIEIAMKEHQLVWHPTEDRPLGYDELHTNDQDGSIILTALVEGLAGYECVAKPEQILDVANIAHYDAKDYFKPIHAEDGVLKLEADHFYILSGAERVRIPLTFASEMVPMDERSGDFRSHYAGFLDPGWGWGADGEGKGRPFTLEVRPFENLVVRAEQPIAKIRFERMIAPADINYDTKASNYVKQEGPKLGKQFI